MNDWRQLDDVTSDDKLFRVLTAATGNARSLIVESRVSGTTSAEVDDKCSESWLPTFLYLIHLASDILATQLINLSTDGALWSPNRSADNGA